MKVEEKLGMGDKAAVLAILSSSLSGFPNAKALKYIHPGRVLRSIRRDCLEQVGNIQY